MIAEAATRPELHEAMAVTVVCLCFAIVVGVLCGAGVNEAIEPRNWFRRGLVIIALVLFFCALVVVSALVIYNAAWTDYRRSL